MVHHRIVVTVAVFSIGFIALSRFATADNLTPKTRIIAERPSLECGGVLTGAGSPRTLAADVIGQSIFTRLDNLDMRPLGYGTIWQIKDADAMARGGVIYSTSTGRVVLFGQSPLDIAPFGVNATILGLRPGVESRKGRRYIAFTGESATVVSEPNWSVPLVTRQHGILDANFVLHNHAAVVLPKSYRIYALPKIEGEPAVLEADVPAQSQFWAGAIDPYRGRIVALDGKDLVVITVSGEREERGARKVIAHRSDNADPVDKIVLSSGTKFYIRQGQKLTFYDTDGNSYGTLDVGGPLQSMEWDHSDKLFAFSSTTGATGVYNLETQQVTRLGQPGDSWRRVAWSKTDGLLLALGLETKNGKSAWTVDVWNPKTGEKLTEAARFPLVSDKEPYPYLVGLRGSLALGDFQFYVVWPNGRYSNVAQSLDANVGKPKSTVIVIPKVEEERRVLN